MSYIEQFQPRRDNLCSYFEFESTYTESRHMPWVVHDVFRRCSKARAALADRAKVDEIFACYYW